MKAAAIILMSIGLFVLMKDTEAGKLTTAQERELKEWFEENKDVPNDGKYVNKKGETITAYGDAMSKAKFRESVICDRHDADEIFDQIDSDGDGYITLDDVEAKGKHLLRAIPFPEKELSKQL